MISANKKGTELWFQVSKLHDELHDFEKAHRDVFNQYKDLKHKYKEAYSNYIEELLVYEPDEENE